ncbi:hypothetical protein BDV29DRAFT_172947 [Aspergillus leporis]|uniref:Uncharacterized protein n=1 Tax=Aspergillus leporis TaxID=41062 RepID=A0A5N5X5P6_9EURO|nr:hypothetical protein BDV29DRAFT_172947 [Aspergillus leporis]
MNPSDETAQPQIYDARAHEEPRNDSTTSESSLANATNSIANVAESSINEAKNKLTTVASNESVRSVWEQVRSMATGRNGAENQEVDTSPNQEEIDIIDNMEKEKIAEFLREKNKSDARLPKKRH